MNSQVSPSLGLKGKNGFQFITTLYELVIKTVQKERGENGLEKITWWKFLSTYNSQFIKNNS